MADTNLARSLPPAVDVTRLTDAELLAGTRRLVGRTNLILAELLAHLGEVESRGLHRTRACSSLYVYCVYELRFSEDEACRRVAAARLAKRFPVLLDAIASGELHLTGLLLLGPHLTDSNLTEVLLRAKHRTKRELARLVRVLDPLPAVPARIEPLGPEPAVVLPRSPTWQDFVSSFCPVRDLDPGDRPRDWLESANDAGDPDNGKGAYSSDDANDAERTYGGGKGLTAEAALPASETPHAPAPARTHLDGTHATHATDRALAPERYKVQFTATAEYVRLVDEARALLSHVAPGVGLEELHLRAMRAFVATLKKRKYATKEEAVAKEDASKVHDPSGRSSKVMPAHPRQRGSDTSTPALLPREIRPRRRIARAAPALESPNPNPDPDPAPNPNSDPDPNPRQRRRHIPAAVRRSVYQRDGGCCTYVDASGRRCAEAHRLEFHHRKPFAAGGEHEVSNLTLRCASHNALAAEEDFGRERMQEKRSPAAHESFREAERSLHPRRARPELEDVHQRRRGWEDHREWLPE